MLASALLPSSVGAQEISLKELVGSWIFVSAQDVKPDGSKIDPWGPNPKGAAMYDANGRFTFMIMRSDLPKFASNNRAQATAEEGKAVAQGMIAFYGTYTVNEADKTLTTRIEGVHTRTSSAANKSAHYYLADRRRTAVHKSNHLHRHESRIRVATRQVITATLDWTPAGFGDRCDTGHQSPVGGDYVARLLAYALCDLDKAQGKA